MRISPELVKKYSNLSKIQKVFLGFWLQVKAIFSKNAKQALLEFKEVIKRWKN